MAAAAGKGEKTAAQVAAEELADEETWIMAGNKRGAKGVTGTAVEKVREAIEREPGGVVGPDGLTGELTFYATGIRALPPQLFTQTKLGRLLLFNNYHLSGALPPEIGALTELTALELSGTAVSRLPVEAAKLTKLERLECYFSRAPNATVSIPAAVFEALPRECVTNFGNTHLAITGAPGGYDVVLPTALTEKAHKLTSRCVQAFLSGEVDENGNTAAQAAAEELADEETWIKAGNKRGAKGGSGTAVEKVRKTIKEQSGGTVGAGGLIGTLDLGFTGIHALPPQIFTQKNLKALQLFGNRKLSGELPPEIGALTELTKLSLGGTAVSSLPIEAAKLTKLMQLFWYNSKAPKISGAGKVRIPAAVFAALLPGCVLNFRFTHVKITGAPGGIDVVLPTALTEKGDKLTNRFVQAFLRGEIDENGNTAAQLALKELAGEETWIKAGNTLGAKGVGGKAVEIVLKAISEEPGSTVALDGLTGYLALGKAGVRALPAQLFTQTKLQGLMLDGNPELSGELPPEIGALTELRLLDLDNTGLSSLPVEAQNLTKLELLRWDDSKAFGAMVRVPAAVFAALPPDCGTLFAGTRVAITGAPGGFDVVLPTVLTEKKDKLKNRDVQEFLAAFHGSAAAARPRWLRAMVVGMADAGKSTLIRKLAGTQKTLDTLKASALGVINRRVSTFGVDVVTWETNWPVDDSAEDYITVTLYDFAGQPEYHPTHELFLAPDVLFVVVINLKTALAGDLSSIHAEAKRVEEWMRLIASRAPGARVLVVGTHADSSKVDCTALQSGFSSEMEAQSTPRTDFATAAPLGSTARSLSERLGRVLSDVMSSIARQTGLRVHTESLFIVDALHGNVGDFVAFEAAFRNKAMEIVGERDAVPASIFKMADTVGKLARKSPVLSLAGLGLHMLSVHNEFTPIVPLLLRSAGIIEHFADVPGLGDDVFLSPEWLAKMLAAIVDERRGHGACIDGIVDAATLHRLWARSKEVQNEDMRASLIRVMRAFGLLHPIDVAGERFVMPSLLSAFSAVSSRREVSTLLSRLEAAPRVFRRVYTFSVFPSGLLPRVFSRLHGVRDGKVLGWLAGLLFEMPRAGSSATGLLRAEAFKGAELVVSATHDDLISVFEKALLVVRDVIFPGLQVFREGISISVFAASSSGATEADSLGDALSSLNRGDYRTAVSHAAWRSSEDPVDRLVVDLGVPMWDPLEFEVRTESPSVVEIDVARDLEARGIQLGSGGCGTVEKRTTAPGSQVLSPGAAYALKLPNREGNESFQKEYEVFRRFGMISNHLVALMGFELGVDGGGETTVTAILMRLYDTSLDKIVAERVKSCEREDEEWFDVDGDIISWFRQVCLGIQTLHVAGVAHLDLKTENVFVLRAGVTGFVSSLAVGCNPYFISIACERLDGIVVARSGPEGLSAGPAHGRAVPISERRGRVVEHRPAEKCAGRVSLAPLRVGSGACGPPHKDGRGSDKADSGAAENGSRHTKEKRRGSAPASQVKQIEIYFPRAGTAS
jgi:Leucine-rich repeat (LRR) protein